MLNRDYENSGTPTHKIFSFKKLNIEMAFMWLKGVTHRPPVDAGNPHTGVSENPGAHYAAVIRMAVRSEMRRDSPDLHMERAAILFWTAHAS